MPRLFFIALLLLFAACDGPTQEETSPIHFDLPQRLVLTATAMGSNGLLTGDCELSLLISLETENERTAQSVTYAGFIGGEVFRSILTPDGSGFSFFADSFGEVITQITLPDSVKFITPVNQAVEDSRFWHEQGLFAGTINEDGVGAGTWACAPIDLNQGGYVDTSLVMQGTWQVEPEQVMP